MADEAVDADLTAVTDTQLVTKAENTSLPCSKKRAAPSDDEIGELQDTDDDDDDVVRPKRHRMHPMEGQQGNCPSVNSEQDNDPLVESQQDDDTLVESQQDDDPPVESQQDNDPVVEKEEEEELEEESSPVNFAGSPLVTLFVGKGRVKAYVHKDILMARCPFFEKMLSCGMQESLTNEVELPEEDVESINAFTAWIYSQKVENIENEEKLRAAFGLWLLADKWLACGWQNQLIDAVISFCNTHYVDIAHLVWASEFAAESPLLKLMKMFVLSSLSTTKGYDVYRKQIKAGKLDAMVRPGGMSVREVMLMVGDGARGRYKKSTQDPCADYHVHEAGEDCPEGRCFSCGRLGRV